MQAVSGLSIPQMIITRWGVYTLLLARALLLWPFIIKMDVVKQLLLYKTAEAAAAWPMRRLAVDAAAPAISIVLLAQRSVVIALEVLGTSNQPTFPLVAPVVTWAILKVRLALEIVIKSGAGVDVDAGTLIDCDPPAAGESPMLLAARYLLGLQQSLYVRYPFHVSRVGSDWGGGPTTPFVHRHISYPWAPLLCTSSAACTPTCFIGPRRHDFAERAGPCLAPRTDAEARHRGRDAARRWHCAAVGRPGLQQPAPRGIPHAPTPLPH